jgi:lipopolysaccharide/colanic/teichoic acid biosynthesis glycosyltransferase
VTQPRINRASRADDVQSPSASQELPEVLNEEMFKRKIAVERKRTERCKDPFLLMLLEADAYSGSGRTGKNLNHVVSALLPTIRETDVIGWYKDQTVVGVMFTGLAPCDKSTVLSTILNRVSTALRNELTFEQFSQISISLHFFPDDWNQDGPDRPSNLVLYPDLESSEKSKRFVFGLKRIIDITGSALLIVAIAPLFAAIAIAIKASSKGPVLFRQQRVGQYGRRFMFLKFRSMHVNNDHSEHKEYVRKLIAGDAERISLNGQSEGVYKLANDRRITPIGRILRRTSLDELPQFFNVLWGDMSLVGPRPPIPYELAAYETWHRRRLLQVKPGITGLWQVAGRNRIPFDDMVRLDLHYATSWTPLLDVKILLRTPGAVIKGAY